MKLLHVSAECKPYLIDEKPSALVSIDAYLSLPTYPYLSIPIQSSSIWIYLYMLLVIQNKSAINIISIAKAVIAAQLSSKGLEHMKFEAKQFQNVQLSQNYTYTTAKSSLHTNGTTPDVCRNTMNLTLLPHFWFHYWRSTSSKR